MKTLLKICSAIAMLFMFLPISTQAENPKPEIQSLVWSDEKDGVLISFRKNGIEGDYRISARYGSVNDPMHGGGMNDVNLPGETAVYCWHSSNLIPGENFTFQISVITPDNQEYLSDEVDITIPITDVQSPVAIDECFIPDLPVSALREMKDQLLGLVLEGDFQSYNAVCRDLYDRTVSASFRASDVVRVLIVIPDGQMDTFTVGDLSCSDSPDEDCSLARMLAQEFVSPLWIETGCYTLRFYDWERKCLIGTYSFHVV